MGGKFERWLARPSTLCFLRRVIRGESGHPRRAGLQWQQHRCQSTAAVAEKDEESGEPEDALSEANIEMRPRYARSRSTTSKRLLYMSLRSGVPLLSQDLGAEATGNEMAIETDVNSNKRFGKLAVDLAENKHNMVLWMDILSVRQRWHGQKGIQAVWNGLRRREVDLPTEGPEADFLWKTFIHGSIVDPDIDKIAADSTLLTHIFEYTRDLYGRTGQRYSGLYKAIVGRWVRLSPNRARLWHKNLVQAGLANADDMMSVIEDVMQSTSPRNGSKFFRPCYKEATRRDMYDTVIAEALQRQLPMVATLSYHQLFLAHGDAPSQAFFNNAEVQRLFALDHDRSLPMRITQSMAARQDDRKPAALVRQPTVSRETMSTLVGDVHGIKPKELSDGFCARMFATRAFSVGWVIKGLALFGVEELGPLAMREMAVRAGSPETFCEDMQDLKAARVSVGESMFSRLIVRIAEERNDELWKALLDSDQHPEAYDDAKTQSDLLKFYMEQQKWVSAHLSLLAASLSGQKTLSQSWNRMLQHYMLIDDYPATVSTLQSMQNQEIFLTPHTMDLLRRHILPPRQVSKRPVKGQGPGYFEPTEFVAKAYLYAVEQGQHPRSSQWVEVLKRLGMDHRWEQFERVVLTLLHDSSALAEDDEPLDGYDERVQRLKTVFTSNMRKAIFIWGFRKASIRNQLYAPIRAPTDVSRALKATKQPQKLRVEWWAQGLPLLQRLRDSGFEFDIADVRIALIQRMWILFGPGYSTRAINHEARRNNRLSLAHYIRHANEVWPGLVDWVDEDLLQSDDDARILPAFFGDVMRVSIKRGEGADVKAWAEALSSGAQHIIEPKKTRHKEAAWLQSPLRVQYRPMQPTEEIPFDSYSGPGDALDPEPPSTSTPTHPHPPPPTHQSPAAHSPNSHPPPNPQDTPAKP